MARRKSLAPVNPRLRQEGAVYTCRTCKTCSANYEPIWDRQRYCTSCSKQRRAIWSHLTGSRGKRIARQSVSAKTIDAVYDLWYAASSCVFCGRYFSEAEVTKSIDHIDPVCSGGNRDDVNNMAIACLDCNRSKGRMSLEEWLHLCRL